MLLALIGSHLSEDLRQRRLPRAHRQRPEIEQVCLGGNDPALSDELMVGASDVNRDEPDHRMAVVGNLDGLTGANLPDGRREVVAEFAYAHLNHGHMMPHMVTCGHMWPLNWAVVRSPA